MIRLLFLLSCFPFALPAQSDTSEVIKRLEIGVSFGVMEHSVDFTPNADEDVLRGNHYGVTFRYFDHHLVGFQAELSYVQAGWRETVVGDLPYQRRTNYAEILILTQISIGRAALQPMLQAGPYLAAPLSDEETFNFVDDMSNPPSRYGYNLPFRLNYGAQVGGGFNLSIGQVTLQAEGRYLIGFNDIIRTGDTSTVISRRVGYGGRVAVLYAW